MENNVRKKVYRPWKMVLQDSRVVNCIGLGGEGIEVTSHLFKAVDDIQSRAAGSSLEGDMLAEMGYALLFRQLIGSSGVNLVATINHW